MFRAIILPIFRSTRLCVTVCGIMHPRCCRPLSWMILVEHGSYRTRFWCRTCVVPTIWNIYFIIFIVVLLFVVSYWDFRRTCRCSCILFRVISLCYDVVVVVVVVVGLIFIFTDSCQKEALKFEAFAIDVCP